MKDRKLTPKQQAFSDYYIETGNASQSAIRAGYSKNTAKETGYENLTKPHIKAYIDKQMQELADKRIMGAQEALELLTSIARGEITEEVVVASVDGVDKVSKIPDVRDRQKAAGELLKRHTLGDNQKLRDEMLKAQINKLNAEIDKIRSESDGGEDEEIIIVDKWTDEDE